MRFEVGQTAVFTNPDTFNRLEFKIATIHRSARGHGKDLLEAADGFNARAEFCIRKE